MRKAFSPCSTHCTSGFPVVGIATKLLELTLAEIDAKDHKYELMDTRNDIDMIEDLRLSTLADEFSVFL